MGSYVVCVTLNIMLSNLECERKRCGQYYRIGNSPAEEPTHEHEMTHRSVDLRSSILGMPYDRLDEDGQRTPNDAPPNHVQCLHPGTDNELTLLGYQRSPCRIFLSYLLCLLSLGALPLTWHWRPEWQVYFQRQKSSLSCADVIILKDADGQIYIVKVEVEAVESGFPEKYMVTSHNTDGSSKGVGNGAQVSTHLTESPHRVMRFFIFQHLKYIWVPEEEKYHQVHGYDIETPISSLLNDFRGYTVLEQMHRQQLYGYNIISVEVKSYLNLLVTEILNPFYVFQIASILLWSFDNYILYASCIFFVSCLSIIVSLLETRKQSQSLHDMVEASSVSNVTVLRKTEEKNTVEVDISTKDLVPGDVVVVPPGGCIMACDAVLISGNAIVNESMLTGESVPVTKTPVLASEENEIYSPETHKRHTLFSGTAVLQTRYYGSAQVLAVVVRTGFSTAKGELVRAILYPRPLDFKFYKDAMRFIIFLFMIASVGMSYSIYVYVMHKESALTTLVRTLDIVTIVVPPALPAAMTVGTYYAQSRLKARSIFCISPPRINVSGKVKLVCFDKTGTLTEDGLEVWGVVDVQGGQLGQPVTEVTELSFTSRLVAAMASCHSLTYLHGSLTGDPLDIKMFEATKWELEEPVEDETQRFDSLVPTLVRPPCQAPLTPSCLFPSSSLASPSQSLVSLSVPSFLVPPPPLLSSRIITSSSLSVDHGNPNISPSPPSSTVSICLPPAYTNITHTVIPPSIPSLLDDSVPNPTSLPYSKSLPHTVNDYQQQLPTATLTPDPCSFPIDTLDTQESISTSINSSLASFTSSPNNTLALHNSSPNTSAPLSITDTTPALPSSSVLQHPQPHPSSAPELVCRSTDVNDSTSCLGIKNTGLGHLPEVGLTHQTLEEPAGGNYDQMAPTVVKPSSRQVYVDPPNIANVAETPLEMPYEIGIVRQFPFSSSTQRMSVLVRVLGQPHMELYAKGAPEVIQNLCLPNTLPDNLSSVLTQYTVQGFRVIALAHRTLQTKLSWHAAQRVPRDQVECELSFVGLLVLQNTLKPETSPVIRQLMSANIRTVMVTGDNILTAISVARDCGMVGVSDIVLVAKTSPPTHDEPASLTFEPADTQDIITTTDQESSVHVCVEPGDSQYHLAVSGRSWSVITQHFPSLVPRVVARGTVFARMSPDQKAHLVEELQAINYIVAMCGDGANDCGALKTAHVGISLSEAEASVAAPFTSHTPNIECVPSVICEGRCALTTNFSVFKYMALYSIIQFISVLILYSAYSNLSDPQFLYIDLFIVTVLAIFMGYTGPSKELIAKKPLGNLLGAVNMFSVISQIALVIIFQAATYLYLQHQPWFVPNKPTESQEDNVVTWETASIFYVSSFQYLTLCIVYSPGKPFRKPIYTNVWLSAALVVQCAATTLILLCPWPWLMKFMNLQYDPDDPNFMFRIALLLIVATHFVLSISTEYFLANSYGLKKCFQWLLCKRGPKNQYKVVIKDMDDDPTWPPVGVTLYASPET
ncbi:hypothetical protein Pcinc_029091 [Petrolisthes cinctipes]|uniref:Cation-transporting ATPase n=1 Tax=Petrolisthes cinctipes TaxID=88211 RepID=A0AAE1K6E3_PETCI|nr:hypothetical protein Pcinc_029091 [Petrolisthes cinctipes]